MFGFLNNEHERREVLVLLFQTLGILSVMHFAFGFGFASALSHMAFGLAFLLSLAFSTFQQETWNFIARWPYLFSRLPNSGVIYKFSLGLLFGSCAYSFFGYMLVDLVRYVWLKFLPPPPWGIFD